MARNHLAAIRAGRVDKGNIIGIRKALNAAALIRHGYSVGSTTPKLAYDEPALVRLEAAIAHYQPLVTGELLISGFTLLESPRWRNRFNALEHETIADIDTIRLARFDWIDATHCVPVYRVKGCNGHDFLYRNIPWQTAWSMGLESGPTVETE
jgi:hypothetical protein